jgi:ElaB/YqjD/DUF883 family membrane-anchored ribosome-binding protein
MLGPLQLARVEEITMNQRTQKTSRQAEQSMQQGVREERSGIQRQREMQPIDDLIQYVREYTRERPETVAIACFAVGFILGWRLKPW